MATTKTTKRLKIDKKQCILCNLCIDMAPQVFYEKGGKSEVKEALNLESTEVRESIELAVDSCPVQAITFI